MITQKNYRKIVFVIIISIILLSLFLTLVVGGIVVQEQITQKSFTYTPAPYWVEPSIDFQDYIKTEPGFKLDTISTKLYYEYETKTDPEFGDYQVEYIRGINVTINLGFEENLTNTSCVWNETTFEENCTTIITPFEIPDDFYLTARSTTIDDIIYFDTDISQQEIASSWNKQIRENDGNQNITLTFKGNKFVNSDVRYVSTILNFTEMNDFQLYFGTGSTVTNYTWETGHLQNNTVRDVFVYEKDFADNKTSSWYIEKGTFPNVTFLAVHDEGLDIIDADAKSRWMSFNESAGNALDSSTFNTVTALDGSIYVGSDLGLYDIDFDNDTITRYNESGYSSYATNITARNSGEGYGDLKHAVGEEYPEMRDSMVLWMHLNNETLTDTSPDTYRDNKTHVYDYSPGQNNGTFKGSLEPFWNCSLTGKKLGDCGLHFDGSNDWVNLTTLNTGGFLHDRGTISIWISTDFSVTNGVPSDSNEHKLFDIRRPADNDNRIIVSLGASGIGMSLFDPDGTTVSNAYDTTTDWAVHEWVHITGMWDISGIGGSSDETRLYINTVETVSDTTDISTGTVDATYCAIVGSRTCPLDPFPYHVFDGVIDEFAIFNRSLTGAEVTQLYANKSAVYQPTKEVEVHNESGTIFIIAGSDDGITIVNKTDDSSVSSAEGNLIGAIETNSSALFYANDTGLSRLLDFTNHYASFSSSDSVSLADVQDIEINDTDVFCATDGGGVFIINTSSFELNEGAGYEIQEDTDGSKGLVLHLHLNNESLTDTLPDLNKDSATLAYDYSTGQNNGTLVDNNWTTPIWNTTGQRLGTGAINFDGDGDYINIDNTRTDLAGTSTGSICFWINPDDVGSSTQLIFMFGDTAGGAERIQCDLTNTRTWIRCIGSDPFLDWNVNTDEIFVNNVWNHFCLVHDGSMPILYANGVENTADHVWGLNNDSWFDDYTSMDNGRIGTGSYNSQGDRLHFDGQIDEFAIWNRTLSAQEISQMYYASLHNYMYVVDENNTVAVTNREILSGKENNITSLALNGSYLLVGSYGTDGAISKIDLSANTNIENWTNDDSNVSLNSNFTLSLDVFASALTRYVLAGQLEGLSAIIETLVIPDVTAPTVENTFPFNNTNQSIEFTNLTWNVTDAGTIVNCSLFINNDINTSTDTVTEETNQTFNITFQDGSFLWNIQCEDDSGNKGNSSQFNITIDTLGPKIDLISPPDNALHYGKDVTFKYNVSDLREVKNCTLHFEGTTKTDTTITESTEQTFTKNEIQDGKYNWNISCRDDLNNLRTSEIFEFTVIHSSVTSGAAGGGITCPDGYELVDNHCVKKKPIIEKAKEAIEEKTESLQQLLNNLSSSPLFLALMTFSLAFNYKRKKKQINWKRMILMDAIFLLLIFSVPFIYVIFLTSLIFLYNPIKKKINYYVLGADAMLFLLWTERFKISTLNEQISKISLSILPNNTTPIIFGLGIILASLVFIYYMFYVKKETKKWSIGLFILAGILLLLRIKDTFKTQISEIGSKVLPSSMNPYLIGLLLLFGALSLIMYLRHKKKWALIVTGVFILLLIPLAKTNVINSLNSIGSRIMPTSAKPFLVGFIVVAIGVCLIYYFMKRRKK